MANFLHFLFLKAFLFFIYFIIYKDDIFQKISRFY
jgi:hypothetical protein